MDYKYKLEMKLVETISWILNRQRFFTQFTKKLSIEKTEILKKEKTDKLTIT